MGEVNHAELRAAANDVLQAAILGHELASPLQNLASAGRSFGGGFIHTTSSDFLATPSVSLAEVYDQFRSGVVPTDYVGLILNKLPAPEFERDLDPSSAPCAKNAFYQEFCRPNEMVRSIRMRLLPSSSDYYRFNFFRGVRDAAFEDEELRRFDAIAPFLDATASICQTNFEKQTGARATLFLERKFPAFALARDGSVIDANQPAQGVIPDLLDIAGGRLTLRLANEQKRINAAIQSACVRGTPAIVRISSDQFPDPLFVALPVDGPARDVFARTAAFAVLVDVTRKVVAGQQSLGLLASSLSLTGRESDVVGLVASGHSLNQAATQLEIGIGTARGHLKAAMQKAGVHSQVELAALVAKLDALLP
jgi:DNA-binding CsgD family transcriptional regulator